MSATTLPQMAGRPTYPIIRHTANEGMDSYRQAFDHMKIRPDRQNETQFLLGSGRFDTVIWMHYLDAN